MKETTVKPYARGAKAEAENRLATIVALSAGFASLLAAFAIPLFGGSNLAVTRPSSATRPSPARDLGLDPEGWKNAFPAQYESYMESADGRASPSGNGGGLAFQRLDAMPYLRVAFAGSPFAVDYREDRGHPWSWEDLKDSERIGAATPASCLSCKTPYAAELHAKEGWAFAARPLSDFLGEPHPSVSCASCHDPATGRLRASQPAFLDAMAARGVDLSKASTADMRSFVCAQCHSEYYFEPEGKKVVFPWAKGLDPGAMYAYYEEKPAGFAQDFLHAISGAPMLKAQHPDYEEYSSGVHAAAGVSCADCHMPRSADGATTSHRVESPLHSIEASCLRCHAGWTSADLFERVVYIQKNVKAATDAVGAELARTHELIARLAPRADAARLERARRLVREAQWYWDYVASSNSGGFHSPVQCLAALAKAGNLASAAREALLLP